jgi:hypothetical protein
MLTEVQTPETYQSRNRQSVVEDDNKCATSIHPAYHAET